MDGKKIIKEIEVILLVCFLSGAIVFTFLSQRNYDRNLTKVDVTDTREDLIWHDAEYTGTLRQESSGRNIIEWYMKENGNNLQAGSTETHISKVNISYIQNQNEKIEINCQAGNLYSGLVDEMTEMGRGSKIGSYISELPEGWTTKDTYIVSIGFCESKKPYILPTSCIMYDKEQNQEFVYTIESEKKIWGTEYRLKKMIVKSIETNGELSAVESKIGKKIATNVNENMYDGMLVKIVSNLSEN